MSGIVALLRVDGQPVAPGLVGAMVGILARRGPDRRGTAVAGPVGLGHALLATNPDAERELQPLSCDGVHLTGDLRVDARDELRAELGRHLRADLARATDPELVLHAYRVWGERCVEHLLGDYAFVVWDERRRTLFAARDPFGVKLLYYAEVGRWLVLSNTLACVRAHPEVSDALDPATMDALVLQGDNPDRTRTTFADIRCVPAAHILRWSPGAAAAVTRHWEPPAEVGPPRYSDARDTLEHFRTLLEAAVADRIRTPAASILMSGGLDSTMLAAAAGRQLERAGGSLAALTVVFDELIPDRERHFSSLAAHRIGIPIRHFAADHLYTSWDWLHAPTAPEPIVDLTNMPCDAAYRAAAERGRVVLTGYDGDALLDVRLGPLWRWRAARGDWVTLARELAWHARHGRIPRVGVRAALTRWRERVTRDDGYPPWIRLEAERTRDLRGRWRAGCADDDAWSSPRSGAYRALGTPVWRSLLDAMDPGVSGHPIEHRHPLLDLRLIRFALALPPVPWCVQKQLFRETIRGVLPSAIVDRPKEPLPGDPLAAAVERVGAPAPPPLAPELAEYVDASALDAAHARLRPGRRPPPELAEAAFNTFALNAWLSSPLRRSPPLPGAAA